MRFTTLASITTVVLALAANANAQQYDFATCNPTTVAATACDATHTSCCTMATSTTGLLSSGSDKALLIPMDYCHQDGSATADPTPTIDVSNFKNSPNGATESGTTATFSSNQALATSYVVGATVVVSGVGVAGYNGTWVITGLPTTKEFTVTLPTSGLAASGGGSGSVTSVAGTNANWCADPAGVNNYGDGMMLAYGLVYRLMQNNIPVYWLINPSKSPPALGTSTGHGYNGEIEKDVDFWIMQSTATRPTTGTILTAYSSGTRPVNYYDLSSVGVLTASTTNYSKQQFPVRGGAFLIPASYRTAFTNFMTGSVMTTLGSRVCDESSYTSWNCRNFSKVKFYEIPSSGVTIGWYDWNASTFRSGFPVAVTLDRPPPRIALFHGSSANAKKWLGKANLSDISCPDSSAGVTCPTSPVKDCTLGQVYPTDSVACRVTEADMKRNALMTGGFTWLWMDHQSPVCATMPSIAYFLKMAPNAAPAGNVMAIEDGVSNEQLMNGTANCAYNLLGRQDAVTATNKGLDTPNGNTNSADLILRYPQNLFMQFGDLAPAFASGTGGGGMAFTGSYAYNSAFGVTLSNSGSVPPASSAATPTLHRLVTVEGSGTVCTEHAASTTCDIQQAGATYDNQDVTMYGRYLNSTANGIVYYLPGTQIQQNGNASELRMLLNSILAIPTGSTTPGATTTTEVTRSSPITATIGSATSAIVQGTYEYVVDASGVRPSATQFAGNGDSGTFEFPYLKGHMRAYDTTGLTTGTAAAYSSQTSLFDAANNIPSTTNSYSGCTTHFTNSCRTIFTTTTKNCNRATPCSNVYLQSSNAATLGPLMGANLTSANQAILIQRIIAGVNVSGTYTAKLGGVDRSTVAVIEPSPNGAGSATRPKIAYFGAADGMLHAVCASTTVGTQCSTLGTELWAYIPRVNLPNLRYNTAKIDGSPRVLDVSGIFTTGGSTVKKTVLMFQTGSGNATDNNQTPAVYALDITDPYNPSVLWEYTMSDVQSRGTFELGVGLTLAAGKTTISSTTRNVTWAQTSNEGTGGPGNVVTAIDIEAGTKIWQTGQLFPSPPRAISTNDDVVASALPGGAVPVDKSINGTVSDLVYSDVYGQLWEVRPDTGASRYGGSSDSIYINGTSTTNNGPLFKFTTNYRPTGAKPALFSPGGAGTVQYAVMVSGGYADPTDFPSSWISATLQQYAVAVSLNTATASAPLSELSTVSSTALKFLFPLGTAGEKGYSQAHVVGDEVYFTTDTGDVNAANYGVTGTTGKAYAISLTATNNSSTVFASGTTLAGGASSMAVTAGSVFAGSARQMLKGGSQVTGGANTAITNSASANGLTRQLWLRSE